MKVYNYNSEGYLIGVSELDESDKCQITGNWLIPGMATEKEPPIEKEGFEVKFIVNEWKYIKLLTNEEKKIQGLISLEDGELIQDNKLIRLDKPSELHSWNGSEWYLDDVKVYNASLPTQEELNNIEFEANLLEKLIEWYRDWETDRKSTRLNSSHSAKARMPSSA